jgi:hypothetical protein
MNPMDSAASDWGWMQQAEGVEAEVFGEERVPEQQVGESQSRQCRPQRRLLPSGVCPSLGIPKDEIDEMRADGISETNQQLS